MESPHRSSISDYTERNCSLFWPHSPSGHTLPSRGSTPGAFFSPSPVLHPGVAEPSALMEHMLPNHDHFGDVLPMSMPEPWTSSPMPPMDDRSWYTSSDRLFTVPPPTPTNHPRLFQHALVQDQLNDVETDSHSQSHQISLRNTLTPGNRKLYEDCKGNRPSRWSFVLDSILTLQYIYGELSILATPLRQKNPLYKCAICSHPSKAHTTRDPSQTRRRWDLSPHILSHALVPIKPWFCACGKSFIRSHDLNRHAKDCTSPKILHDILVNDHAFRVASSSSLEAVNYSRVDTSSPSQQTTTTRDALPAPSYAPIRDLDRPHGTGSWNPQSLEDIASARPPVYHHIPEPCFYREKWSSCPSGPVFAEKAQPANDLEAGPPAPVAHLRRRMYLREKILVVISSLLLAATFFYVFSFSGLSRFILPP